MGKVTYYKSQEDEELVKEETKRQEESKTLEEYKREEKLRKAIKGSISAFIIFGVLLCVGIFVIIYGAKPELFRNKSFVPTQATVARYEWRHVPDGGTLPFPVYNYVFEGEEYELKSDTSVSPAPFEVGEVITIYVNPSDPTDIVTPLGDKFFVTFGTVVLVISIFALGVAGIRPILEAKYPKSDWPKFISIYIPCMLFVWSGFGIIVSQFKSPSGGVSSGFILWIVLAVLVGAFATFISAAMIIDMVQTVSLNRRSARYKNAQSYQLNSVSQISTAYQSKNYRTKKNNKNKTKYKKRNKKRR